MRIAELRQEVAALPRHIAHIEKTLEAHQRKLEADRAALSANQKERRQHEMEIQAQDPKISKLKDQMLEARTNEQYRAFQHEIEYCQQAIRKREDRILELMLESETLEQNVSAAEVALEEETQQVEREKNHARARTAADQSELEQDSGARRQCVSSIAPATMVIYEKNRKRWNGVVVAEATDGRCAACHISLRPQFFQDLRKSEKLMCCENCGRILQYNQPVSVEVEMDSLPVAKEQPTGH